MLLDGVLHLRRSEPALSSLRLALIGADRGLLSSLTAPAAGSDALLHVGTPVDDELLG